MAITESGYEGAWQDLLDTYENQHVLLFKYMRNIVNCPAVAKQTATDLKRLLTTVRQSKRAFEALQRPVEHWSDWFLFLTERRQIRREAKYGVANGLADLIARQQEDPYLR